MHVRHFQRKRLSKGHYSIERVFELVREQLAGRIVCSVFECPWESRGIIRRVWNVISARGAASQVNHVTGDVHYLLLLLPRQSTILTIHDCGFLHGMKGIRKKILWYFWLRIPAARAKKVVAVSEATRIEIASLVPLPKEAIEVIPSCIAPVFQPSPAPFRSECPRILHIGSTPNKNIARVIEALAGVRCTFVVVAHLSKDREAQLAQSDLDIEVHEHVSEEALYRLYCSSDMLLFASTFEGFGLPIVEAQQVGRPVVTSDCSSMPEVAGKGAVYVDPFSVASIRRGVQRIVEDEVTRAAVIEAGFRNAQRFSVKRTAEEYASLYAQVAAS